MNVYSRKKIYAYFFINAQCIHIKFAAKFVTPIRKCRISYKIYMYICLEILYTSFSLQKVALVSVLPISNYYSI